MIDAEKFMREYQYQSPAARLWFAHGQEVGQTQGRVVLVRRQLMLRFGPLPAEVETQIATASISELDAIGERLLRAPTLQEALGQH